MTSIGNRMKENYEDRYRFKLTRRMPVIIRLDGKSFHTLTRRCIKPFDDILGNTMVHVMLMLLGEIQGAKCGYQQSDEISILLTDFDTLQTDAWFDYNVQKIASVSAGYASAWFTSHWCNDGNIAVFDSRVFNIPKEEVCNYFVWRQKDWIRNSVQMLAQAHFSPKQLHGKKQADMHEMLHGVGVNWAKLEPRWKNGVFKYKNERGFNRSDDMVFTENRMAVEKYLIESLPYPTKSAPVVGENEGKSGS